MRRTFILHANGAKLPTDLLGLTTIWYDPDTTPAIVRQINQTLRKAIETEWSGSAAWRGDWWRSPSPPGLRLEPSAVSLLTISRDRAGALSSSRDGRGRPTARCRRVLERGLEGTGRPGRHLRLRRMVIPDTPMPRSSRGPARSSSRASIAPTATSSRARTAPDAFHARTSGIYLRADPGDKAVLDGTDAGERAALIERRLQDWTALANT